MLQNKWRILYAAKLVLIISNFGILAAQKRQNIQSAQTANDATVVSLQQLYDNSVQAQEQGDLNRARALLEQVQQAAPEYKDVKKRIKTLDSLIAVEVKKAQSLREQLRSPGGSFDLVLNPGAPQGAKRTTPAKDREQKTSTTSRARDKFDIDLTPPPDLLMVQKVSENPGLNSEAFKLENKNKPVVTDSNSVPSSAGDKAAAVTARESEILSMANQPRISTESTQGRALVLPALNQGLTTESTVQEPGFSMLRQRSAFDSTGPEEKDWWTFLPPGVGLNPLKPCDSVQTAADSLDEMSAAQYDSLYRRALFFIERRDWSKANVILKLLYSKNPDYRSVSVVYGQVQKHNSTGQFRIPAQIVAILSKLSAFYLIAVLTIVLIMVASCRLAWSPMLCARLCLSLGRVEMARKLCEKMIVRNPDQAVYSCLAGIYLKMARTDAMALKVYQIALKLNPNIHNSEQMSAILAQNYLSINRSDADAIEVMEKAISAIIQSKDKNV